MLETLFICGMLSFSASCSLHCGNNSPSSPPSFLSNNKSNDTVYLLGCLLRHWRWPRSPNEEHWFPSIDTMIKTRHPFPKKQKLISLSGFSFIHSYLFPLLLTLIGTRQCGSRVISLCSLSCLVSSLQEQLRRLYPRLKALAFGAKPESTLHTYLPSFLSRATPNCPDDMKREVAPPRHAAARWSPEAFNTQIW